MYFNTLMACRFKCESKIYGTKLIIITIDFVVLHLNFTEKMHYLHSRYTKVNEYNHIRVRI